MLHREATDALSGTQVSGSFLLEPFGVRILLDIGDPAAARS